MRLGQLARKISVRPAVIVDYLLKKNVVLDEGSNARIEDVYVAELINHFAPELAAITSQEHEAVEETPGEVEAPVEVGQHEELILVEVEATANEAPPLLDDEETNEVIKAPKVELPGLRVVGRIELPEPKKKEHADEAIPTLPTDVATDEALEPVRIPRKTQRPVQRERKEYPRKNPVAVQREREQQQAEHKQKEDSQKKKQQRANHYSKKVKVQSPVRSARLHRDEVEEWREEKPDAPKTFWGRVAGWFGRK